MIGSLADVRAIESVPLDERDLPPSTYALLERGTALSPDGDALVFFLEATRFRKAVRWSYRRFLGEVNRAANLFRGLGIGEDDVVSLLLPNLPETWFALLGAEAAGIVNPINPLLEPAAIADIMNAARAKVLVTLAPFPKTDIWQKVEAVRDRVPTLETILTVDLAGYLTGVRGPLVKVLRLAGPRARSRPAQPVLDYGAASRVQPADRLAFERDIRPDDIAALFHTGGTTGAPKLARHTHANEVYDGWVLGQVVGEADRRVLFCGLPLFHVNAVVMTGLFPLLNGYTVVLGTPQGWRGPGLMGSFWRIVEHFGVNFFSGVPTVFATLLNHPVDADVSSLQFAICGAAPMPVQTFHDFEEQTGLKILEGYGLTEGTCASAANPPGGERRVGSIGLHFPYQPMRAVVLDAEGRYERDCEPDEVGTVVVHGPNVFPGYAEARHDAGIWVEIDGERWLNTGDLGRRDGDGYFWLTGRRKELIIRGGHNIDPNLIEAPLLEHPAVAVAAAVGRPDARLGEVPVAYVQLAAGATTSSAELKAWLRQRSTERAAFPREIRIVNEVPLTAVGKVFKPALSWRETEDVYREELHGIEGVAEVQADVRPDRLTGARAFLRVRRHPNADHAALLDRIAERLGRYTTPFEVETE